jgi:hypothetical protein
LRAIERLRHEVRFLPPLDLQNSIILRAAIVINNEGGLGGD